MHKTILLVILFICAGKLTAQSDPSRRSTFYLTYGTSGANLREFNEMLAAKGLSPLRNGYRTLGVGYQSRINDFIFGFELYQNNGPSSLFREYELDYRTSRFYVNVGYALTEEGRLQFIHYMSLGMGYLNFQMLKNSEVTRLGDFLADPAQGFILRKNNIHKGSNYFGGFLTEIGFQLGYDVIVPSMEESIQLIGKFGYSFSPFENAWEVNAISFDNTQAGAFLRLGAGISLPDGNLFYDDATLGFHFFYGKNFVSFGSLNESLAANGYETLAGTPGNIGFKIIGENGRKMYGAEIFNLSNSGTANETYGQTLNSIRFYGNLGYQLFKRKNLEMGVLGGLGYGNVRYTLQANDKPDFPLLFEEPDFDGRIAARGLMAKPELLIAYALPMSKINPFSVVYSIHAGYEVPIGRYTFGATSMRSFMKGPYLQFGLGFRP
nr:hypothetical protein [Cytophagales bacterium]